MKKWVSTSERRKFAIVGLTIVEVLIIIVVLGILCTIAIVSYRGVQMQAEDFKRQDAVKSVETRVEAYAAQHAGVYPATTTNVPANWKPVDVRTDANCFNGSAQSDWIPGIDGLPQSTANTGAAAGVDGSAGCYLYASDGNHYVLSAWNMIANPHTNPSYYRRLGFRPFQTATSTQFYSCNANVIGGASGGYDITKDYYKHSYTISNIEDCDEVPPAGA